MQVSMHGIDSTGLSEFPSPEYTSGPFISVRLIDGKGSEFVLFLKTVEDAYKLYEVAQTAMDSLGIMVAGMASI